MRIDPLWLRRKGNGRGALPLIASVAVGAAIVVGGIWTLVEDHCVLVVENLTRNTVIFSKAASSGDNVWVVFINSVEGLPVADHFVVDEHCELLFQETIYMAPYGGYIEKGKKEVIAPMTVRIHSIREKVKNSTFFFGYKFRQMLFINGHFIDLKGKATGGDLVSIYIKK